MNKITYIRKEYSDKWLFGVLSLSLTSEDRGNGEYKHMLYLRIFGRRLLSIEYRTGATSEGPNTSLGYVRSFGKSFENDELCERSSGLGNVMLKTWERGNLKAQLAVEREVDCIGSTRR